MKAKLLLLWLLSLIAGVACSSPLKASEFPERPIHLVVGFAPGGAGDLVARLIAKRLGEKIGQPVIVENRPGADTTIGAEYVAHAKPDGYTVFLYTAALTHPLHVKVSFDPIKSFSPIMLLAEQPSLLVANPTVKANSLQELVAVAKSKPGQINFGSSGPTTPNSTMMNLFMQRTGIELSNVPYSGEAPIMTALLGNEVQVGFLTYSSVWSQVQSGQVKALAVTTNKRFALTPDLPTVAESVNSPDFDVAFWYGIVVPSGVPGPILKKLHDSLSSVLKSTDGLKDMTDRGLSVVNSSPEEFSKRLQKDSTFWASMEN